MSRTKDHRGADYQALIAGLLAHPLFGKRGGRAGVKAPVLAKLCGVSTSTVYRRRKAGGVLPPLRGGQGRSGRPPFSAKQISTQKIMNGWHYQPLPKGMTEHFAVKVLE